MNLRSITSLLLGGFTLVALAQGYQDGVDYYNADRFDKAKIILDKADGSSATDKAVRNFYLGELSMHDWEDEITGEEHKANLNDAAAYFNKGIEADPAYGYNYVGLGEIALKNGNKSEAEKQFKAALATSKKDAALIADIDRA